MLRPALLVCFVVAAAADLGKYAYRSNTVTDGCSFYWGYRVHQKSSSTFVLLYPSRIPTKIIENQQF